MQNTINNPSQSDTKRGERTLPLFPGTSTSTSQNSLMKLTNTSGVAQFGLPTAITDLAIYTLACIVGGNASAEVASTNENVRLLAYGTGNAGDQIILADPTANSGAQAGMVRSFTGSQAPTTGAVCFRYGIAEETFVSGQLVKCRFLPGTITK